MIDNDERIEALEEANEENLVRLERAGWGEIPPEPEKARKLRLKALAARRRELRMEWQEQERREKEARDARALTLQAQRLERAREEAIRRMEASAEPPLSKEERELLIEDLAHMILNEHLLIEPDDPFSITDF